MTHAILTRGLLTAVLCAIAMMICSVVFDRCECYVTRSVQGGSIQTKVVFGKEVDDTKAFDSFGRLINHTYTDMTGVRHCIDYEPTTGHVIAHSITE